MEDLMLEAKKALEKSDPALARTAHDLIPRMAAEIKRLAKRLDEVDGHGCGRGSCRIKRTCSTAAGAEPQAPAGDSPTQGASDQCGLPVGLSTFEHIKANLAQINPEALLADGLEDALVGYTLNHHGQTRAVYDYTLCEKVLMERDGMTEEGAEEYLDFNTLSAYVGENGPIYIYAWRRR
jgi:hypothetical protein